MKYSFKDSVDNLKKSTNTNNNLLDALGDNSIENVFHNQGKINLAFDKIKYAITGKASPILKVMFVLNILYAIWTIFYFFFSILSFHLFNFISYSASFLFKKFIRKENVNYDFFKKKKKNKNDSIFDRAFIHYKNNNQDTETDDDEFVDDLFTKNDIINADKYFYDE